MLASIPSASLSGDVGRPVSVEVHVSNGLLGSTIPGLPDAAVRESRDRVRAALLSSGLAWPLRKVTVNFGASQISECKIESSQTGSDLERYTHVVTSHDQGPELCVVASRQHSSRTALHAPDADPMPAYQTGPTWRGSAENFAPASDFNPVPLYAQRMTSQAPLVQCSFCLKPQDQVRRMLGGRNGFICNE